jgi:2-haloacid dehalogenase
MQGCDRPDDTMPVGIGPPRPLGRRAVLGFAAALSLEAAAARAAPVVRAIAFDAFPLFDPRPVLAGARRIDPAGRLGDLWFQRIFALTWRTAAAERYASFEALAADALADTAAALGIALPGPQAAALVQAFYELPVWEDVKPQLAAWRAQGVKLALLSNMNEAMLASNVARNALTPLLDHVLSTDRVRAFKPSPRAYALGPSVLGLPRSQIAFAAFAAWDAQGAAWFGFPTAWVNRLGQPSERGLEGVASRGPDLQCLAPLLPARDAA